jgi:hypothetical protein
LAFALLAGCLGSAGSPARPAAPLAYDVTRATALDACGQAQVIGFCTEASLAADGQGVLYAENGLGPEMAKSTDDGKTWTRIAVPMAQLPGTPVVSDNDALVRVLRDGSVLYVGMFAVTATHSVDQVFSGLHVAISHDHGATWPVNKIVGIEDGHPIPGDDRPWVAQGPDGSLYLVYSNIITPYYAGLPPDARTALPNRAEVVRSDDGGATWGPMATIYSGGHAVLGDPVFHGDELVVPSYISDDAGATWRLSLMRSPDRGQSWREEAVRPALPADKSVDAFVSAAVRADGTEGVAWREQGSIILVATKPAGAAAWSDPLQWSLATEHAAIGPGIIAADRGWAVSYITRIGDDNTSTIDYHLALGSDAGPEQRIGLGTNKSNQGPAANSDFATVVALPGRGFAVAETSIPPHDGERITVDVIRPHP